MKEYRSPNKKQKQMNEINHAFASSIFKQSNEALW